MTTSLQDHNMTFDSTGDVFITFGQKTVLETSYPLNKF